MKNRLTKGILTVFVANLINLLFSLVTGFALPKWLSDETYATIRTYQLYVSYAGALHLGFVDGVYLKYGGRRLDAIPDDEISVQRGTLLAMQFAFAAALIPICFALKDYAVIAFCLTLVPFNMAQYYRMLYQATGEFSAYGAIANLTTVLLFCANVLLLFGTQHDGADAYLTGYVVAYVVAWAFTEWQFSRMRRAWRTPKGSIRSAVENVRSGCLLMLGNFSSIMLTSIDRWFVKFLLNTVAFARYSFSVSVEGMLNVVVTPISTTLYNFFCGVSDRDSLRMAREYIMLFAVAVVAAAFPAYMVVERFLPRYLDAVPVMFLLFAGQVFFIIIKCLYVNLYKARHMQRIYFTKLVATILVGILLNAICFFVWHEKEAFALGTLLSAAIWFMLCQRDFPDIALSPKQYAYLAMETLLLLACGLKLTGIEGLCVYVGGSIAISLLLMRKLFLEFIKMLVRQLKRHPEEKGATFKK